MSFHLHLPGVPPIRCSSIDELLETAARLLPGTTLELSDDGQTVTARPA